MPAPPEEDSLDQPGLLSDEALDVPCVSVTPSAPTAFCATVPSSGLLSADLDFATSSAATDLAVLRPA